MIKIIIATVLLIATQLTVTAQSKRWEHHIYMSTGFNISEFDGSDGENLAFHIGYGLNHYLTDKWSVMPGIAYRLKNGIAHNDGSNTSECAYIDVPILAQYHLSGQPKGWVFEVGPVLSFISMNDSYYNDANPSDELNGKAQFKKFDLGVEPGVYYQTKHWRFGIKYHVGLLNTAYHYPDAHHSFHNQDITVVLGFHF